MVDVNDDHLGCAAGRSTGLDGPGGAVPDLEEAHQPGGLSTPGERFAFTPDAREVRSCACAHLEQTSLTDPEIHDAAGIHQVVVDAHDETCVGCRSAVRIGGLDVLAGLRVDVPEALCDTFDAVAVVEACIEPLRRIRCRHLMEEHVGDLVFERLGVFA